MTRTYELPHFSVARVVSHAEYVEGCGGGPTVGVGVGTNCVGVERGGVWVGVAEAVGVGGAAVSFKHLKLPPGGLGVNSGGRRVIKKKKERKGCVVNGENTERTS